jgi:LysM repeat protein
MSINSYKTPYFKAPLPSRSWGLTASQNNRLNQKRSFSSNPSNDFIDLGWLNNLIERFDKFSKIGTITYQLIALGLLTLGLVLAFQNFSSNKNSENVVINTKAQIAKTEEKRIWTDANSIDKVQNKINFSVAPVAIAASSDSNPCSVDKIDSNTTFSSDSTNTCTDKKATDSSKTTNSKFAKVKTTTIKVESGESLSYIAASNKSSVSDLIELNGLKSNNLKVGQSLVVPVVK